MKRPGATAWTAAAVLLESSAQQQNRFFCCCAPQITRHPSSAGGSRDANELLLCRRLRRRFIRGYGIISKPEARTPSVWLIDVVRCQNNCPQPPDKVLPQALRVFPSLKSPSSAREALWPLCGQVTDGPLLLYGDAFKAVRVTRKQVGDQCPAFGDMRRWSVNATGRRAKPPRSLESGGTGLRVPLFNMKGRRGA